ncbi:MAG: cob(I)yrinic acid a,c-diamide adenosyltransferase [Gammaproteobacteria bacterium]|nr:cob(I)yrinic acid a,c-diamide adenosyltransferase [Gammaproteobacteria bacterium]
MTYRLTKIYTRTGDEGYTSLRGERISKDDLLIEALGTVDELNANIGVILSQVIVHKEIVELLRRIQNELFDFGGELHLPERKAITAQHIKHLEEQLDQWNETLPPLKDFLLPNGTRASVATHVARTVCRRAERCLVRLHRQVALENIELLRYLNRLSDLLFVISRILARENGQEEIIWQHLTS